MALCRWFGQHFAELCGCVNINCANDANYPPGRAPRLAEMARRRRKAMFFHEAIKSA
jgi:hypothetical protein